MHLCYKSGTMYRGKVVNSDHWWDWYHVSVFWIRATKIPETRFHLKDHVILTWIFEMVLGNLKLSGNFILQNEWALCLWLFFENVFMGANFYCYANFSIVFRKSCRGQTALKGHPLPPVEESQCLSLLLCLSAHSFCTTNEILQEWIICFIFFFRTPGSALPTRQETHTTLMPWEIILLSQVADLLYPRYPKVRL